MRFQSWISPIAFALTAIVLLYCQSTKSGTDSAESPPLKTVATPYTAVTLTTQESPPTQSEEKTTDESRKPFRLSSRFHLKKGTDEGYLIVKFELPKKSYIYSLTQPELFPKTKITVAPSPHFSLTGKQRFTPDRNPKVIESDPDFGVRLEKHSGVVQFFAPIKINKTITANELQVKIEIDGQVCNETTCLPISRKKTTAKFAGFFDPTDKKAGIPKKANPKKN
ncbi:hypothetical protein N9B41_00855 [bacterium]|nr:hypothetical protein [Mariniblastus sp.]MDA7909204.1 hypothetical protein [bacterium]MDA7911884.1 hypothetical protein [bacterium]MDB4396530.1 hypothetical protein [bacterium]MDC3223524.1 hypothetical protein [Mariniblastus sp.]